MLLTAKAPVGTHHRHPIDVLLLLGILVLAVLCLVLALPLAGGSTTLAPGTLSLSSEPWTPAEASRGGLSLEALPGLLAACGEFGEPFVASMSPASVPAGGTFRVAWCDPSWVYLDGAYAVDSYRVYWNTAPTGTFQLFGELGKTYGAADITTDASDAGKTYYFFVRSVGRTFSFGNWIPQNKDTNIVSVQVTSGGGGGGGTGSCGQFGTPFWSAISPDTITTAEKATLTWCNPAWAYLDGAFEVSYYQLYAGTSQAGPFSAFGSQIGAQYTGTYVDSSAPGTFYILVRAVGRQFSLGTWTNTSKDSSISMLRVNAAGGGGGGGGGATCTPDTYSLCLFNGRFKVQADYKDYSNTRGQAKAVAFTSDTGYFWIFSDKNVEIVAKIVSFCDLPSKNYGFYAGGLTDIEVTLKVTDTKNNIYREYKNELNQPFTLKRDGPFPCP